TPGVYHLSEPITVSRPDTVVLGQGFATLVPQRGTAALTVASAVGVKVCGLIIGAGPVRSPALLALGHAGAATAAHPDLISDVFFRVGGGEATATAATISRPAR